MADQLSDLTYMHQIIITSQDETLPIKDAHKIWAAIFGVKIQICHAENGIFSQQPFISEIEYPNPTMTFCGVVLHHQNTIVERKIQNITIGDRTLLRRTKIY